MPIHPKRQVKHKAKFPAESNEQGEQEQELFSPDEAAEFLGISRATLYNLFQRTLPWYEIKGVRKRRIKRSDLEALLEKHEPSEKIRLESVRRQKDSSQRKKS